MNQVNQIIEDQKGKGVNLVKYMECSAYRQTNVENVFDEAFKLGIAAHKDAQKNCTII